MNRGTNIKIYQTICDNMDNQLLKFPKYTLLDDIPLELWGHVAQYFYYQFYIGNYGKNYEGFRKISRNEITKDFANTFIHQIKNDNNVYCLGNSNRLDVIVDDYYLILDECAFFFRENGKNKAKLADCFSYDNPTLKLSSRKRDLHILSHFATFFIPI